jgi:thiamine biosynthesis protein ThiI
MNSVVVHYQEIALKGRNRPWFIARLVRNIRTATADLDVTRVVTKMGRIEIMLGGPEAWEPVAGRLRRVFGIANFSRAALVPLEVGGIANAILTDLADLGDRRVSTFRVSAKRADKRFPLTSPQIEREVGGRIKEATGWTVDLENPELTISVEALTGEAF